jgi:hypothetical protein
MAEVLPRIYGQHTVQVLYCEAVMTEEVAQELRLQVQVLYSKYVMAIITPKTGK